MNRALSKFCVKLLEIKNKHFLKCSNYCVGVIDNAPCIQDCSINTKNQPNLTIDDMNQNVRNIKFVLKKQMLLKAQNIETYMKMGRQYSFNSIIKSHLGDSQALGQQPLTFVRQVLAVLLNHDMMHNKNIPKDVIARAGSMVNYLYHGKISSCGYYAGLQKVCMHVAEFLKKRDGCASHHDDIYICAGATVGVNSLLNMFTKYGQSKPTLGIMVPIPNFPLLLSATTEYGLHHIGYYLDEKSNWSIKVEELEAAIEESKVLCKPKIIAIVNPGNPTGQVLSQENIKSIIKFAYKEKLFIIALEDYQQNIYEPGLEFHSFKKVMNEMGGEYKNMELASFMTISKGFLGECGIRGGILELCNVAPDIKECYESSLATTIPPSVPSQAVIDILAKPPEHGDPSYELYRKETLSIMDSYKENAKFLTEELNSIKGYKCNPIQGAMYAFPRIHFSVEAILAAKRKGKEVDEFYASKLLEDTGIFVIPGTGFGQWPGTYHIRTTILPPKKLLEDMMKKLNIFHKKFLDKYGD